MLYNPQNFVETIARLTPSTEEQDPNLSDAALTLDELIYTARAILKRANEGGNPPGPCESREGA